MSEEPKDLIQPNQPEEQPASEQSSDAPFEVLNPRFAPKKKRRADLSSRQLGALRKTEREAKAAQRLAAREMEGKPTNPALGRPGLAREGLNEEETTDVFKNIWGIRNKNVIEQCFENGLERAQELGVAASLPYWRDGADSNYAIDVIGGRSEVLSMRELFALYTFTCKGLKVLGVEISFGEWLNLRDRARKDLYWLAETVLRIPLVEEVHRPIIDNIYPELNADGMFTLDYSLTDMHAAVDRQAETKEYLVLDPRAWMKTAVASAFALQFLLNFPESRVFDISGSDDLALGLLRIMKGYLGHETGGVLTAIHHLFPEYTLRGVDAKSEEPILLPCRKFYQRDFSFSTFSCMSASSGRHSCLFIADDIVQEKGSEVTRAKLKDKADTLLSNIPDKHAIKLILGTRYDPEDWYSHRIALLESDPASMKFHCRGVMSAKAGFENIPIQDLTLDQVVLNWPNQYGSPEKTMTAYRRKMTVNLNDFLHQQMNSPQSTEDLDKLHFDRVWITRNTLAVPPPIGEVYGSADIGFSKSKYRDPSALTLWNTSEIRTRSPLDGSEVVTKHVSVLTQEVGHWDTQEKAVVFVRLARMYPEQFKTWIIEKYPQSDDLDRAIQQEALKYGMRIGTYWAPIVQGVSVKFHLLKAMETPLQNDLIKFVAGPYLENLIVQLEQLDGTAPKRQSSTRKDDAADSLQLGIRYLLAPLDSDAELKKLQQAEREKQQLKLMHDRIFGSAAEVSYAPPPPDQPYNDRGVYGIPGLRGFGRR